ncbi:MAG: prenyltransferase/squalene oxidase repeat-containing protein [Candidatus Paceibacterota bacterium]
MKNIKKILLIVLILLASIVGIVRAEEEIGVTDPPIITEITEDITPLTPEPIAIHLTITDKTDSIFNQDINVNACNNDNAATSDLKTTPYCAILQSGIPSDWNWSWAPGAFLNSLNNIAGYTTKDKDNNDVYHYWSWSLNGTDGTTGLNQYELQPNDLILLNFIDPIDPIDPIPEPEIPPVQESSASSKKGGSYIVKDPIKPIFDLKKAFEFIISQQKENGSFDENLYTDWIAVSLATTLDYQDQKIKLIEYLFKNKNTGTLLTDYERHAMALMSLGLNPYNTNGENYIKKITDSFDGKQFGDINEDNDDIFALIVLQNAGFLSSEKMIADDIAFILSKQKEDGSWDSNVDMTGAGIEALSAFSSTSGIGESLAKAKEFLKQNQKDNGGWDNVSSTAWAMEGILGLNEKPEDWIRNGNTPLDYLAFNQDPDGGIRDDIIQNKIWGTAYTVTALSGKTWNQIMQKFEKIKEEPVPLKIEKKLTKQTAKKDTQIKQTASLESLANQNAAAVINAIDLSQPPTNTETPKRNWFVRFLEKIFSIF